MKDHKISRARATLISSAVIISLLTASCASSGYNTQKGAAIGAATGAIAGQVLGRNTVGTLIGAGAGMLIGGIIGSAVDQNVMDQKIESFRSAPVPANAYAASEEPPGQWETVPGRWQNGQWIPAHRVWVPVNP